jgi:predicted TIM-barrel fold metal-dependent hydrolase
MNKLGLAVMVLLVVPSPQRGTRLTPRVDHHQHLFSPETAALATGFKPLDAADLVKLLDNASISRALVLSVAYQFGNPNRPPVQDEYAKVKAENDWTSAQVARFPERLRGFCGVNPLKDYAIEEIGRCAKDRSLHFGLKMHFGNSDVNLDDPQNVDQLRRIFRAANDHRMAIAIHMRASVTKQRPYGAKEARHFLEDVLPSAPDVPVHIAHLAGGGGYDDPSTDDALSVFADAIEHKDPRMAHVYFDISGVAGIGNWSEKADLIVKRVRQIGIEKILYGSDSATGGGLPPAEMWARFLQLPFSQDEFRQIANNIAPYMQ